MSGPFAKRATVEQVEEGVELAPKFDDRGLIPAVTTDFESGELLMHGFMNEEALRRTIETGEAHYYSRSREAIWHKGATSGLVQTLLKCELTTTRIAFGCAYALAAMAQVAMSGTGRVSTALCRQAPYRTRRSH